MYINCSQLFIDSFMFNTCIYTYTHRERHIHTYDAECGGFSTVESFSMLQFMHCTLDPDRAKPVPNTRCSSHAYA